MLYLCTLLWLSSLPAFVDCVRRPRRYRIYVPGHNAQSFWLSWFLLSAQQLSYTWPLVSFKDINQVPILCPVDPTTQLPLNDITYDLDIFISMQWVILFQYFGCDFSINLCMKQLWHSLKFVLHWSHFLWYFVKIQIY